jgi:hypothetical protein
LDFSEATVRIEVQGSVVDSARQVGQPLSIKGRLFIDERLGWGLAVEANDQWNLEDAVDDVHAAVEMFEGWTEFTDSVRCGNEQDDDDESQWYDLLDTLIEYHSSEGNNDEYIDLRSSFWPWYKAIEPLHLQHFIVSRGIQTGHLQHCSHFYLSIKIPLQSLANCRKRQLIINAIGFLPVIAEAGDVIALISGLHMPVVLRLMARGNIVTFAMLI